MAEPTRTRGAGRNGGAPQPVELEVQANATSAVDAATFSALYGAQFATLVRLATVLTGEPDVARDVVQDAFVRLHLRWSSVHDPVAYVRRSVVNGCHSHHRRLVRTRRAASRHRDDVATDLAVDHTRAALDGLPRRQRDAVVLKYYAGLSEAEIAAALGCRPGSVGPMVHRALERLRGELS